MRNMIITSLAGLIATATFASSAMAASPYYCQQYAQKAVWAESQNLSEGCGFTGARWSFDYAGHYAWCLTVPKYFAKSETEARKWGLYSC